jgi:putative thioredoxin
MASDNIIEVTEANFDPLVIEYSFQLPVVVDYWADWCVPCKTLEPILERLAIEADGNFRLAKVNVDSNPNLAIRFGIHSIPAVKGFRDGKVVSEFYGVQPEPRIRDFILAIAPTKFDLLLEKANSLLEQHYWDDASNSYTEILEQDPNNSAALLGMAKCHIVHSNYQEARKILASFPPSKEYNTGQILLPLIDALTNEQPTFQDANEILDAAYQNSLRLIKRGNYPAALDGLLDILRANKNYKNGEPRKVILGIFLILGENSQITREYRKELSTILF